MTKFQSKAPMHFGPPKAKKVVKKCPHAAKVFGRILKGGRWYHLPCGCKVEKES